MNLNELLNKINSVILNPLLGLLFAVAFLMFIWGIFQFIGSAATDDGREKGKKNIMWGIVGMFIMIAVYGIIKVITGTFGITPDAATGLPGSFF